MGTEQVQPERMEGMEGRTREPSLLPSALVQGDLQDLATVVEVAVSGHALIFLRSVLHWGCSQGPG